MKKVSNEFMEFEMCELIREFRYHQGISQHELYRGLCSKKEYFQLESGDSEIDELLFEQLLSRLHVQQRLFDVMLDDDQFERIECRHNIKLCIQKEQWQQAEQLLEEYEKLMPKNNLHQQYVFARRAEVLFQNRGNAGPIFKKALELTMQVKELEKRMNGNGVISADELWLYFRYRNCVQAFTEEEYRLLLQVIENCFLKHRIYPKVYFEAAYELVLTQYRLQKYVQCREICGKVLMELRLGKKTFYLPQVLFLDAASGMWLRHNAEQERELYQQCKQAYYISLSFCKPEMAQKMLEYCEEKFGWHITEQVK